MATLADVARRAGVSPATASRIISGSTKLVTDELRARVLRAVDELQYVPNAHAQLLARAQRTAVGVIVHDVSDPYFAEITRGLQQVATTHGRLVIICNSYRDPARELEYVELLRAQQVAAIVLAGSGYHDAAFTKALKAKLAAYTRTGGRVSVIGRHELPGDAVMPANEEGGYLAGCELFGSGHRRVGVIAGPKVLTTTTDRLAGLRRAAREFRGTVPARRVAYAGFDRDGGAEAITALLDSSPDLTAVVALNDQMAVGALSTLRARGIAVPDQISLIGFDDMPIARDVTPPLTTVRLPLAEMGARAMSMALDHTHSADTPRIEPAQATLVRRESTRSLPA
ncbi:LacI family DNA-binding transcriptional regulator [Dactylosporangium matsuzakiense]|uniref:LacI family transcriptional regulator n=1 Tax=Dactylosporangium matsuzakiense TaxID=53360 RepID=A0A9W6KKB7_9ACTN|nr:LacI family DNA-binding transcriptional regulator [Dactylosporangium matsuzakiense]UWZ46856.1 LacI family DNA-binding transcriptional regulator [Dactylosporangium matsuzakiense]GLL01836.1 LacI family transcriptional regulator [Dactylosporangium matsuzakiense]